MDVGHRLQPTDFNPTGIWPTSRASQDINDPFGGPCPIYAGTAGVRGGCTVDTDGTRAFTYDQVTNRERTRTAEFKIATSLDGPLNALVGFQYIDSEGHGGYTVGNNEIDALFSLITLYTSLDTFMSRGSNESWATFGELYWTPRERVTVTLGVRYSEDTARGAAVSGLGQAFGIPGAPGSVPTWIRQAFGPWLAMGVQTPDALAITDFYGVTEQAQAAGDPAALIGVLQSLPPVPTLAEARALTGASSKLTTDSVTGRLGVDWKVHDDLLLYAFFSRGSTPGGFTLDQRGQAATRYADEKVHTFEVGTKALLRDGTLQLNAAAFYNDIMDLHVSGRPADGLLVEIENLDAESWGVELETLWRPNEHLTLEFGYGWLRSRIGNEQTLDLLDPTQGDPNLVLLNDIPGSFGNNYVAPRADVLPLVPQAIANGAAVQAPGTLYPDGIPAWFNRAFLAANGVATSGGVPANLDGNDLPTSPEHSVRLALAYTWFWLSGSLQARWDYYWQDESFARVFNRRGDRIDGWHQQNAALTFTSAGERWQATAWVRNLTDEENVTDHYVHAAEGAGPYRNYFLTEPRTYGVSLQYSFGVQR